MIQLAQANARRIPLADGVTPLCVTSPQARTRLGLAALDAWETGKPGGEVGVADLLGGGV